jgi:predicted nucleic acid-binding protein
MENIIIDTGFWFAFYDPSDEYHKNAIELSEYIETSNIRVIIPFPTLYETINTKFTKNHAAIKFFEKFLQKPEVYKYPDEEYRDGALNITFETVNTQKRNLSLTDNVIRMIMDDDRNKINYLETSENRMFLKKVSVFCF